MLPELKSIVLDYVKSMEDGDKINEIINYVLNNARSSSSTDQTDDEIWTLLTEVLDETKCTEFLARYGYVFDCLYYEHS